MADDNAETSTATDEAAAKTDTTKTETDATLGDGGKAALDAERKLRNESDKRAKNAEKAARDVQAKLDAFEKANQSDHEKALDAARKEATDEVTTKYEAAQRTDRIENAVTKLSLKGFKGKSSDGKEITLRFADPDDAQLRVDRALRNGDIEYEDFYGDGKVKTDKVTTFLTELLEEHPRLRATEVAGNKAHVDFDGGKGAGAARTDGDMNSLIRGGGRR